MNTYNIKLDLKKEPLYSLGTLGGESGVVTLRQGDKQGCRINADLYDHGERFKQTGLTAFFVMDLPDHAHYYHAPATYSDGTVSVIVDESYAASVPGNTDNAYFELMQGSTVIASTQSFRVRVLKDARDGKSVPESYDSAIQDAIDNANDAAEEAREAAGGTQVAVIPTGKLDSTSTATAMTATVEGIRELKDGVCMWLENGAITSASGVKLNVNGLGAKPIYNSMAEASAVTTTFNVAYTMLFVYNSTRVSGGCWDMVYGYDSNTTYTPAKLGIGYGTCATSASTAAKTVSISSYALTTGGIVVVKFDNSVPANATLNVTSKGAKAIHYKGAAITAGVIKAGDVCTFVYSTYYHLISIDRWGSDIDALAARLDALVDGDGVSY